MGAIKPARGVKLICGMLAAMRDELAPAARRLAEIAGPIELSSEIWPFIWTDYYTEEMGPNLLRQFVAFAGVHDPDRLIELKLRTNELEARLAADAGRPPGRRAVNLDAGYVGEPKLVLASTKDHSHRLYLGRGIYGEVTLRYHQQGWQAWPWTYPDYAGSTYHPFLTTVRERLRQATRGSSIDPAP